VLERTAAAHLADPVAAGRRLEVAHLLPQRGADVPLDRIRPPPAGARIRPRRAARPARGRTCGTGSGGRGLLLLEIANEPAGDDDLTLPGKQVVRERDLVALVDLAHELVGAVGDLQ
jgi:hypothetical protein